MNEKTICILGAGPSGIVTALKLKQLGYDPLVLDYDKSGGKSMVQSLSPGVFTLLETVGITKDEFQGICNPIERTLKYWDGEIVEIANPPGFLTDRGQFDKVLRDMAKNQGINLLQNARVMSLAQTDKGWEIVLLHEGKYRVLEAGFLVDSGGKKSIIRGVKKKVAASTLAITGCWDNNGFAKNEMRIESAMNYWLWGATSSDGFHVTLFVDPELTGISGRKDLIPVYRNCLRNARLFDCSLRGKILGNLIANDVTPFFYEKPAGHNYIKVGESSAGLDPVSSQGIQNSIAGAVQAAIVINTIITDPGNSSLAIDFYQDRQQEMIRSHLEKTSAVYASAYPMRDYPFWIKRIKTDSRSANIIEKESWTPSQRIRFSKEAAFRSTGCIIGNKVSSRTGLVHPLLKRPVVFWEEREIAPILETLHGRYELSEWVRRWSEKINPVSALRLFEQLKNTGVLVAAGD